MNRILAVDPQRKDEHQKCDTHLILYGDVAIIPICGVIGDDVSTHDIMVTLSNVENSAVRGVVLAINSPGGVISGITELATKIKNYSLPIVAYSRDLCASAGYWIASQTDRIIIGETCEIGSVGVYAIVDDLSKIFENSGIKREVISSGENKGLGVMGTPVTDKYRDATRSEVEYIAKLFTTQVRDVRNGISEADCDGRVFVGRQALDAHFADEIGDLNSAIKAITEE